MVMASAWQSWSSCESARASASGWAYRVARRGSSARDRNDRRKRCNPARPGDMRAVSGKRVACRSMECDTSSRSRRDSSDIRHRRHTDSVASVSASKPRIRRPQCKPSRKQARSPSGRTHRSARRRNRYHIDSNRWAQEWGKASGWPPCIPSSYRWNRKRRRRTRDRSRRSARHSCRLRTGSSPMRPDRELVSS